MEQNKFDIMDYERGRNAGKIRIIDVVGNKVILEQWKTDPITGETLDAQSYDIDTDKLTEIKNVLLNEIEERRIAAGNIATLLQDISIYQPNPIEED